MLQAHFTCRHMILVDSVVYTFICLGFNAELRKISMSKHVGCQDRRTVYVFCNFCRFDVNCFTTGVLIISEQSNVLARH